MSSVNLEHLELLVSIITSFLMSSGLWLYLSKKESRKENRDKLLMGIAHDRIMYLGLKYIQRGWITKDEYENLFVYLYGPYTEMHGNGTAKRLMDDVNKLPIGLTADTPQK